MTDAGKVVFGDNVFIAPACGFHISGHPIDSERRNQGLEYAYPLIIGNNAWFGSGIQVMPGVTFSFQNYQEQTRKVNGGRNAITLYTGGSCSYKNFFSTPCKMSIFPFVI